jgi:16S rRNA (uracil1498-N3)-methyltransferase
VPRIHCETPLHAGASLALPPGAARHVQVLRMQPGDALTLFDGSGGEYGATVERMGRSDVLVSVGAHHATEREPAREVHLALGMPANERMDWLVEKATELGVASIQPLLMQHSVLRLAGDRALKKQAHWQAIAVAACEQSGRNRVPVIHAVAALDSWLASAPPLAHRVVLSPTGNVPLSSVDAAGSICVLSGPEGGLSIAEESAAIGRGFVAARLGARILRAETAPLAALALLTLRE